METKAIQKALLYSIYAFGIVFLFSEIKTWEGFFV